MTQLFSGIGLGLQGSSISQLGGYGPKGTAGLGQGFDSVYVNVANGNLLVKQDDGFLAAFGLGLDIFQTYQSQSGQGWRFNTDSNLKYQGELNHKDSRVYRYDDDGHLSTFIFDVSRQLYVAEDGHAAEIVFDGTGFECRENNLGLRWRYQLDGKLTALTTTDGHAFIFHYQDGYLTEIHDDYQRQSITWRYAQGVLRELTFASDGDIIQHLQYEYDPQGRLQCVRRDLGNGTCFWIAYEYLGNSHQLSGIRTADGVSIHFDFDEAGRLIHSIDGEGREWFYTYAAGRTTVTNGLGERWVYEYDSLSRLTAITGPGQYHVEYQYNGRYLERVTQGNQCWQFSYNAAGDCIQLIMPDGQIILREYDDHHRQISETQYQSFDGNHHPYSPQTSQWIYDAQGHLRFEIKADGTVTEYRYNAEGYRLSRRCYLMEQWADLQASLETLTQWVQAQQANSVSLIDYRYDFRGQLIQEIHYTEVDKNGDGILTRDARVDHCRYDARGLCVEKSQQVNGEFYYTHFAYDALGRLVQTIDNQQHVQRIEYDDTHHRVIQTDPNGLQTLSLYDESGLLLCVQRLDAQQTFGTISYRYDAAGRLVAQTDVVGQTTYWFYDADGQLQGKLSPSHHLTEYVYDQAGHCILTRQYQEKVTFTLSDDFPSLSVIRPPISSDCRIHQVIYNDYQQIAYEIDAEGAVIAYRYDAQGRVVEKKAYAERLQRSVLSRPLRMQDILLGDEPDDRVMSYYYDTLGRLSAQIDGEGAATQYRLDRLGNLIETIRFATAVRGLRQGDWSLDAPQASIYADIHTYDFYNQAGCKVGGVDALGYLTEYVYDVRGLLIEKITYETKIQGAMTEATLATMRPMPHSNDHHTRYRYNDLNQCIEIETPNGLLTRYVYNDKGLISSETHVDLRTQASRQQWMRYDSLGRVSQTLDALGAQLLAQSSSLSPDEIESIWQQYGTRFTYDNSGHLLTKTDALKQISDSIYDEAGLLRFSVGKAGEVVEYRYNAFQQVETIIRYHQPYPLSATQRTFDNLSVFSQAYADRQDNEITQYEYNHNGQLIHQQTGHANSIHSTYNAFDEIDQSFDGVSITTYQYDHRGLLRQSIKNKGGANQTTYLQMDIFGRVIQESDDMGGNQTYTVNKRGERLRVEGKTHGILMFSYDAYGRLLSASGTTNETYEYDDVSQTLTVSKTGSAARIVTQFNAFGDKILVIDGNHQQTTYQYDAKGQLVHIESPEHATTDYVYDANGQVILQAHSGKLQIRYTYDAAGHVLRKIVDPDGLNQVTAYLYDTLGRQLSIIEGGHCRQMTYDNNGNLVKSQIDPDGLNLVTTYVYDARNLLVREVLENPSGLPHVTTYTWDALGRCTAKTRDPDGLKLTTTYAYDNHDKLIRETDANQHTTHFLYDLDGRLRYRIDPRGVVTAHCYDALGSEIQTTTYATPVVVLQDYDEACLTALLKPDLRADVHQFFMYDKQHRLLRSYDSLGYATHFIYDANGNCVRQIRYATPCAITDLLQGKCPISPVSAEDRTLYFVFDGLNRERYQIDAKGLVTEQCYDAVGHLIAKARYAHPLNLGDVEYTEANITAHLLCDPEKDETIHYAYDAANRLIACARASGGVETYQYDAAGNQTQRRQYATLLTESQLQVSDWLKWVTESAQDRVYCSVFDAANREIYRMSPMGRIIERRYDACGQLIQEIRHGAIDAINDYQYDGAGRLIFKNERGRSSEYHYDDQDNLISQRKANGAVWCYRYNAANQLIETITPMVTLKSLNAEQWVDETRTISTLQEYDSFGNVVTVIHDAGGLNRVTRFVYDVNGRKITTIYPEVMINNTGSKPSRLRHESAQTLSESCEYNAFGEVVLSRDRAGNVGYFAYDNTGCLVYAVDVAGGVIQYQYDAFHNVVQKTRQAIRVSLTGLADASVEAIRQAARTSEYDRHEYYCYDLDNQLTESIKDRVNVYDAKRQLYANLNPTTTLTYNAFGEVERHAVRLNEFDWAVTRTTYNAEGLKTSVLDAEQYLILYRYDAQGLLVDEVQYAERAPTGVGQASANDRHMQYGYDALGRMVSKTLKQARFERLTGAGAQYETITADLISRYDYDAMDNLVATTDPLGHTAYAYYNVLGQLIAKVGTVTDAGRSATTYDYDALGQLVSTRRWAKGAALADLTHFTLQGESSQDDCVLQVYDGAGHVVQTLDGLSHQRDYSFDANGNVVRFWQTVTDIHGKTQAQETRYTYDALNQVIETAVFKADGRWVTEDVVYNSFGEVVQKGVGGVFTTQIDYDLSGRVWRTNASGYYQIYVYDLANQVTQIVTASNVFGAEYADQGVDLSKRTFETASSYDKDAWYYDLQRQDTVYDALGHVVLQRRPGRVSALSRQTQERIPEVVMRQTVDRYGNVLSYTNARGYTTEYAYNALNQLVRQVLPMVNVTDEHGASYTQSPVLYYAYDALGRAIAMTDANGHSVAKGLDAEGQVTVEIDALGFHREKTYNLLHQLTRSRNERGVVTAYTYDKANRLVNIESPQSVKYYVYDEAGRLVQQTDLEGHDTRFIYDEQDQLIVKIDAHLSGETTYAYDDSGHKISERDANGHEKRWCYDAQGHLLSHIDLGGHQSHYTYNVNGLLLTEHSTSGKQIAYHYYSDGEIEQYVDNARLEVVNYQYDVEGNVLSKHTSRVGDWILEVDDYQYDALGRLQTVKREAEDSPFFQIQYRYDAAGNIRSTNVDAHYLHDQSLHEEAYFRYDANNRLVVNQGQLIAGNITITNAKGSTLEYDACGNISRATKFEGGAWQTYDYHYTMDNQVERVQKNGHDLQKKVYAAGLVKEEMQYDEQGRAAQHTVMTYEAGRLTKQTCLDASGFEVNQTRYQYDAVGNLTQLTTMAVANGKMPAITEIHQYRYALWDNYLQQTEDVRIDATGQPSHYGLMQRMYDVNGLLQEAIDTGTGASTYYYASNQDGVRARKDREGQTSYLTVGGVTIGHLRLQQGMTLELYGGFTPGGGASVNAPGQGFAYQSSKQVRRLEDFHDGATRQPTISLPEIPEHHFGAYTLQAGDTLESVALFVYGDSSLWYLIADANGITDRNAHAGEKGSQLHVGQRLSIPSTAKGQHHTGKTHQPLSESDYTGNLTPTLASSRASLPVRTPHAHHHLFALVVKILEVVAAAVTMVFTAGAFASLAGGVSLSGLGVVDLVSKGLGMLGGGSALGTVETLGVSLAAGFVGNVAGQAAAYALGSGDGIDLSSAVFAGVAAAATSGASRLLQSSGVFNALRGRAADVFNVADAAEMMERDAVGQSLNLAFQRKPIFDWAEFGMSGLTSGILGASPASQVHQSLRDNLGASGSWLASEIESIFSQGGSAVAQGRFDTFELLTDSLGQSVSSGLVEAAASLHQESSSPMTYCPLPNEPISEAIPAGFYAHLHQSSFLEDWSRSWHRLENRLLDSGTRWVDGLLSAIDKPAVKLDSLGGMLGVAGETLYGEVGEYKSQYDIDYDQLVMRRMQKARNNVSANSNYYKTPGSPLSGDASKIIQIQAIDALITSSMKHGLNAKDTAYVLAIARHESGFNPYAAAAETSASGLGQFVVNTGLGYGLSSDKKWDIHSQAEALVRHFIDNKTKARDKSLSDAYIYKFHHDGPNSRPDKGAGLALSNKHVMPFIGEIYNVIYKVF
jgi:YD repeat-containing protein